MGLTNAPLTKYTATINGTLTPARHNNVLDSGYTIYQSACGTGNNVEMYDICFRPKDSGNNSYCIAVSGINVKIWRCCFYGWAKNGVGISLIAGGVGGNIQYCFATNLATGINSDQGTQCVVANNTAVKNTTGFAAGGSTTNRFGKWYNNVSIGNTTNWAATPTSLEAASNNAGISTDTPWKTGSNPTVTIATTDFVSWGGATYAATDDFKPASGTSPQVDSGLEFYAASAADFVYGEVPSYNNGGAESRDVGCYEFDRGFGPHPSTDSRGLAFTGLVAGSKVKVFATGTDTEKFSVSSSGTSETWSENVTGSITVDYVIVKAGYLPIRVTGVTVTASPSGPQATPVTMQPARWYQASSGLTLNTNCFANTATKKFGLTTVSTLQNLASYLLEQWVTLGDTGEAFANKPFPIEANGPNSFSWLYGWEADLATYANTITNLRSDGMRYITSGGAVAAVWIALITDGIPSGLLMRYQQVEGAAPTDAAATGNVNQLIQVYGDLTHGNYDRTGYLVCKVQEQGYDQASVDVVAQYGTLEDQLYVIALIPQANGVAAANPTVSDVTITDHGASPVTWNSKAFSITITDSGTTSGQTIMQWIRRAQDVGGTFQGKDGFNWHDLVQTNGDRFKGVRGALYGDTGATLKGVRVLRGTDAHPDFTLHTADDGTTVSTTPPAQAVATILANSRIQLYNVTTSTELDNSFQTGTTYANTLTAGVSVGDTLRLRVCKLGYDEAEAFAVWTSSGCTFLVNQSANAVYAAWGIDGSTVTEFSGDVTGHIYIDSNDPDGATTKTRLGAWYSWVLTTEIGIRHFYKAVTYLAANSIRVNVDVADIMIENVNATTALRFTDTDVRLYRSDGTSIIAPTSYSIHNDYSGVPDVSVVTVTGSNVITGDIADIPAAVLAAAQTSPIYADLRKVRGQTINGTGSAGDPWGP